MAMKTNGNLQLRKWEHIQDDIETSNKGGAQELMGVILAVTHYIEETEPEEASCCSQAGTSVGQ